MFKQLIKKIIYKEKATSESYVRWLRKNGAKVGDRVKIFAPSKTTIDITRPWLLEIGNDVQITEGVTILTHGYDWSVLKGVHIGNNVIIGANSLVNKDIPDNCVVAGNPAKVIMTLEQYYEKRKIAQLDEAIELVKEYRMQYGKNPDEKALHEFFWLFSNGNDNLPECWEHMQNLVGNRKQTDEVFINNKKMFESMEEFLNSID